LNTLTFRSKIIWTFNYHLTLKLSSDPSTIILTFQLSFDPSTIIWPFNYHLTLQLSSDLSTIIWPFNYHLTFQLSSNPSTSIWPFNYHLTLQSSDPSTIIWPLHYHLTLQLLCKIWLTLYVLLMSVSNTKMKWSTSDYFAVLENIVWLLVTWFREGFNEVKHVLSWSNINVIKGCTTKIWCESSI
jgi:hypothetical protein